MDELIKPAYVTRHPNEPITLGEGPIEISQGHHKVTGQSKVVLELQPSDRVVIHATLAGHASFLMQDSRAALMARYGQHSKPLRVFMKTLNITGEGASVVLLPTVSRLAICPHPKRRLQSLTFHIMNFSDFLSKSDIRHEYKKGGWQRLGRVVLADAEWTIEIQTQPHTGGLIKQLNAQGGHAITHVGSLKRTDGKTFTRAASQNALRELHQLLSFARGAWVTPVLAVGFDQNGERVFEDWGIRLGNSWESHRSWCDVHHVDCLATLYPKFRSLLETRQLASALYWYLRSNRGGEGAGIDSGVILSQAALERIASNYLATEGVRVAENNAASRMRETFRRLKIPVAIPREARTVYRARAKEGWKDIPDVITKVRNELVHPSSRLKGKLGAYTYETWSLAQRSTELLLLSLADYEGVYSDRFTCHWRGEVRFVPWAKRLTDAK
ncbi:MAG: hypothetical protein K2Y27_10255 [Xanthobacteraceae bacterium]|nr:hypothetical protein [Xanthobacteraceae bacterium]